MNLEQLLATSEKCIHAEPPVCEASCPVHLDVISFVSELAKGDFIKAYKLMEKRIPLVSLLCQICEHPCQDVCVRNKIDGPIQIHELEKAAFAYGFAPPKKALKLPKNKGSVAVIGGGISGLVAAKDLDKKGYKVDLFDKADRLGGRLWDFVDNGLTRESIEKELESINQTDIKVHINTTIEQETLKEYLNTYDAVCLTCNSILDIDAAPESGTVDDNDKSKPRTFQVNDVGLFAVGNYTGEHEESVIFSASYGRRMAISIDRYVKGSSLTAGREREGIFETKLNYNPQNEDALPPVQKSGSIFTKDEAVSEAKRCLKCQCNECIKACSHMQMFEVTPDEYIRRINHNERIILGTHFANKMINSCTECGLCQVQCPVGIGMKEIIQQTRESMVERNKMPVSAHDFALKDMQYSNSDAFSMVRKQPTKEQSKDLFYYPVVAFSGYVRGLYKGSGKTGYVFYPGCQLSATHSEYIGDIYKHLVDVIKESDAENDVAVYLGCCGAPADWAGRKDMMEETSEKIKEVWEELGQPTFILACSSCDSTFNKYLPMIQTVSLWEVFDKYGLPNTNIKTGKKVLNIHDACATRDDDKLQDSVRSIVKTLGYKIEELPYSKEKTKCCGYGGLVSYANKEQAKAFADQRIKEMSQDVLVYCAMCQDALVRENAKAYHILDIIYGADELREPKKMPTLSERQNNRKLLKQQLLKEIWGETVDAMQEDLDFEVSLSEDVVALMEERFILKTDIEKVIDNSRKTGERFQNPNTGHYLAKLRLQNVTYWVEYEEAELNQVNVISVYSHRMEVVED